MFAPAVFRLRRSTEKVDLRRLSALLSSLTPHFSFVFVVFKSSVSLLLLSIKVRERGFVVKIRSGGVVVVGEFPPPFSTIGDDGGTVVLLNFSTTPFSGIVFESSESRVLARGFDILPFLSLFFSLFLSLFLQFLSFFVAVSSFSVTNVFVRCF